MNVKELEKKLININVPKYFYNIGSEFPFTTDACCLWFNGKKWEIYYCERGVKSEHEFQYFEEEEEACEYFYKWVVISLIENCYKYEIKFL